jgi:hypothetical protein
MPSFTTVAFATSTLAKAQSLVGDQPTITIGVAVATALLLIIGARMWHQRTKLRLDRTYRQTALDWQDTLRHGTLYDRFCRDPAILMHSTSIFDDLSKIEYEKARRLWSIWLAQRQKIQDILQQSRALQEQYSQQKWWQFSLTALKKALKALTDGQVEVDSSDLENGEFAALAGAAESKIMGTAFLPQTFLDEMEAAERPYLHFVKAIARGDRTVQSLRQEIDCEVTVNPSSLIASKKRLIDIGLPLDPYQERIDAQLVASEELCQKIRRDPLTDYSSQQQKLQGNINAVKHDLDYACRMHGEIASITTRLTAIEDLVKSLRAAKVPSGLPGVQVFGTWRLDEEGYNPDPHMAKGRHFLCEFIELLKQGRLTLLERVQNKASKSIDMATNLVQKAMDEKQFIERAMAEITASSSPADLQADQKAREASVRDYVAQKWAQVRKNTIVLMALHEKRKAARREANSLLEQVSQVGAELKSNGNIVSEELDQEYAALVRQAALLNEETKKGYADWDSLQATIVFLRTARVGDGEESVRSHMKAEVAAYNEASSQLCKLRSDLQALETRLGENWGGAEAVQLLAAVKPAITQVLVTSTEYKQNWHEVLRRIQGAGALMTPAQALVESAVARDQNFHQMLVLLAGTVESARHKQYVRQICGQLFGTGVYCPVDASAKLLEKAKVQYQQRHYDDMLEQLHAALAELAQKHLEAWWMCLQALSMSGDPCAQQYAREQGYSDCNYESWIQEHLRQCEQGTLYDLPAITCERHKPGQFSAPIAGDAPSASDYATGVARA